MVWDWKRPFGDLLARLTKEPRHPQAYNYETPTRTLAGVPITAENAPQNPAVLACSNYIQTSVAMPPWRVLEKTAEGNVNATSHPIDWMLWKRPNAEWSSFQFRETLIHWALFWGNGIAEIERDQLGRPFALWPIHPDRVDICRDEDTGGLFYEVNNGTGDKTELPAADVFHLRGFGHGPAGIGVVEYARQTLGWARAAQLFGASFFGNGANVSGIVTNKKPLSPDALKRQKMEFEQLYKGPRRAHSTAFLDADASWQRVGLDAEDSQIVEVNRFLVEEVCRLFAVPPHVVAELSRATNNNIEHQGIEAVQRCLMPWVKRLEDEADYKLFGNNRRGYVTKINMLGLLRGDFKSQAEGFRVYREMGVVNADEIRERLDMNKMPAGEGGDKYTMQGQYTTLERIGEEPDPVAQPSAPAPAESADDPPANDALIRIGNLLGEPVRVA